MAECPPKTRTVGTFPPRVFDALHQKLRAIAAVGYNETMQCHSRRSLVFFTIAAAAIALAPSPAAYGFVPEERWGATASGPAGAMGDPITLTWSIMPDGTLIQGEGGSGLVAFFDGLFGAGTGGADLTQRPWFSLLASSFDRWSQVSGVTFVYEPNDDGQIHATADGVLGVRGDFRLGGVAVDGSNGTLAYSYFPSNSDVVIDTDDTAFYSNPTQNYRAFRNTLMHELGHGLGLNHVSSNTDNFLLEPTINITFDGPQLDDIRGMHWYYGDVLEKSNGGLGNDTALDATSLGLLVPGETLSIGKDATGNTVVAAEEVDFVSIANTTDADYFAFDVAGPVGLNASLTPLGGVFNQAAQGSTQTQFNANSRSNLSLVIFDLDGTTPLVLANDAAAGEPESVTGLRLSAAGRYYAQVTGASEIVQLYRLDLSAVALAASLPGDFNFDGAVDAADYLVWRAASGTTGLGIAADANGDQVVDAADYDIWRANFGGTAASTTAIQLASVPEPSAMTLVFVASVAWLCRRQRPAADR